MGQGGQWDITRDKEPGTRKNTDKKKNTVWDTDFTGERLTTDKKFTIKFPVRQGTLVRNIRLF